MYIQVNDVKLYYENRGAGQPVILLHGNGEDHKIFEVLIEQLAENYHVYTIDSRDHGKSSKTDQINYEVMMNDIVAFINQLELQKPILYGFSDGGIIGLLIASKYPGILSKLIVSGANTNPSGLKKRWLYLLYVSHFFTRSETTGMMLKEPDIKKEDLNKIEIPVLVLVGSKDMITKEDTHFIADNIAQSRLKILEKESHSSYVIKSPKLYEAMKDFIKK